MKLKLRLSKNREKEICDELVSMGVTISEDADLILTEENFHKGELLCKDETDKIVVELSDILYIESIGKIVYVHTKDKIYTTNSRIYELDSLLPDNSFLRISNSVIINRTYIKRVTPALSQKFYLTLKNGDSVDVTRTYYYKFKEYFGI
ncbi:MAG: LytTR family DNA-binding domain-containing protein [Agathobacter sp.]|nr:LytTR family DNA-binding domain-containing protein [Agathobacter sp.]